MANVEPPSKSSILIYAELLTNIRQITVKVSLPTPADQTTTAEILDDGRKFRVNHNGVTVEASLPTSVPLKGPLPVSHKGSLELTWRLPLQAARVPERQFLPENQPLPWSAVDIKPLSPVSCRACGAQLIKNEAVETWKDLPSENWAEMMEFWHCHKPVEHHQPDDGHLEHRGYGAASAITAQPGVGFVDITSFLFAESDCSSIKFYSSKSAARFHDSDSAIKATLEEKFLSISCSNCAADIGTYSVLASTVAFFKWQISCEVLSPQKAPSSSDCLVATLLSTIARSGSSKSVVMPRNMTSTDKVSRHLQLWVLNNNVIFTSNNDTAAKAAVKVLFKEIEEKEALDLVESLSNDVQDINFPAPAIQVARQTLTSSKYMLPPSERSFQEWQVGLLERWVPQPA
ncbi:Ubiquitin-conjugating enzyme E2C-binding [Cordyceps militaris]|uniref:Ubiquitin-conjugating enzyme E2C-binding n=1 Tax=Cordyceps militaris TaxID=73501 RepID=A0A2H4S561_CORMI|nr:Ubiquitin-conjugating enzyme E2C-binding [Cordyceps militaris]